MADPTVWVDASVYEQAEKLLKDETDAEAVKSKFIEYIFSFEYLIFVNIK